MIDAAAVERLYRSRGHLVLRRARLLLGNDAEAQEALQEVFASLLHAPQSVHTDVSGWLYKATTHHCLNQLRKRRNGARAVGPVDGETAAPGSAEAWAEVRRLLARLPPDVAAAAVYHHVDGMTHDEVAGLLGCSRRQVGYLLERARAHVARAEQSA